MSRMTEHLTDADVARLQEMLLEKREAILANLGEIEGEALNRSRAEASGDLSYVPIHMADVGTDSYNQDVALSLANGERDLLREVDAALNRIEEGTYGFCEGTGIPIPKTRLEVMPWARYCVEYARKLEGGPGTDRR
ncbi:MAG: TraR/DksA C4-type zinc finger protein [Phycisphaerales bacterium]|nr:MAG: TraR/DksA C4-type zinc finger protein [Phycisphaerales bacterium]